MTKHHLNILFFFINCGWIVFFFRDSPMMWVLLGMASLGFLVFLSLGILFLKRNYFIRAQSIIASEKVLLTFDDGPDEILTPKILDILKQHKIAAVFFVIGKKADQHPEIVKRAISEGHLIGNHTQNHPIFFAMMNARSLEKEIGLCDNTLIAHEIHPGNYFRPPVGYTNPRIARTIKNFNKKIIGWNLRSYDSVLKEEDKLLERVLSKVKSGDIVLFHDNLPQTAAVLDQFIVNAKKSGIKFAQSSDLKIILK